MADPRGTREAVVSEVGGVGAVVNFMGGGAVLKVPESDLASPRAQLLFDFK
jgi:hypothetical protein